MWSVRRLMRYGFALLVLILGAAIISLPIVRDGSGTPAIVTFFIILTAAWYGGLGPGLFVTALIVLATAPPDLASWRIVRLAAFLACSVAISVMAEVLHAARRRAEESRRSLAAVLTSIGDAVIATDEHGRITFTNPVAASLTGWDQEAIAGRLLGEIFNVVDGTTRQPLGDPIARGFGGSVVPGLSDHTILIARDGTERPITDSTAPIRDQAGQFIGVVLVFRDDSERRAREHALLEADRRKDEFLAMLAHELRNPLASIMSASDLLSHCGPGPDHEWARGVVDRKTAHLARLLDDLLDVARISRGRVALRAEIIDSTKTIDLAVEAVRPLIEERGHRLEVSIPGRPLWVNADPVRLEQVLVNLLDNAAKYTPDGGRILVSAEHIDDEIVLRVEDDGEGIAPELLPRIFEIFAQGERPPDRTAGGLGVGLSIVKGLVELHDGRVEASSRGKGTGSSFAVRLKASQGLPEKPAKPLAPASASRRARILIIDDNRELARALSRLLQVLGHQVELAHDGPEGIAAARAYGPEVLLLDIGLPTLDGYEVARQLRTDEALRRSLFIAISGYGQEDDRRRSQEAGIDHHLLKPVDLASVVELIGRSSPLH